jgi:hypothetical protein
MREMICCTSSSKYDPLVGEEYNLSPYPASRRDKSNSPAGKSLIQTEGNALLEYDPVTMSNFVRVTVPEGLLPGMMMQVVAPDNSKKIAYVTIPMHSKAGSTFLMKFPSAEEDREENSLMSRSASNSRLDNREEKRDSNDSTAEAKFDDYWNMADAREGSENLKLLVSVPPGVVAGTEIYVKIPGDEERVLPVKVPKGVSQFYVSYLPQHTRYIEDLNLNESDVVGYEREENVNLHDNIATKNAVSTTLPAMV